MQFYKYKIRNSQNPVSNITNEFRTLKCFMLSGSLVIYVTDEWQVFSKTTIPLSLNNFEEENESENHHPS